VNFSTFSVAQLLLV